MTPKTMPALQLSYVIRFVEDMDASVTFHRDVLGLKAGVISAFWSEFGEGDVRLALHPATAQWAAGSIQLGYRCDDLVRLYEQREQRGLHFVTPPSIQHGVRIATFLDSSGIECRVGEPSTRRL